MPTSRLILLFTLSVVLIVAVSFPFFGRTGASNAPRPADIEKMRGRVFAETLMNYAHAHEGRFPRTLSEMPVDELPSEMRRYRNPETNQESDWLYYGGYALPADDDDKSALKIIVASPQALQGHKRIVYFSNGGDEMLEEKDFARRIAKQLKDRQ